MTSRRISLTALAAAAGLAFPGTAQATLVTVTGHVGPLRIDRSTRAQIIAFAGRPEAETRASEAPSQPYDALGYTCRRSPESAPPASAPWTVNIGPSRICRTAYFINSNTGKLVTFFTSVKRFVTRSGVRVGTTTARAERRLHRTLIAGCEQNFYLGSPLATMTIADNGGHTVTQTENGQTQLHVVGGHVSAIVLHSVRHDVGFFDCL